MKLRYHEASAPGSCGSVLTSALGLQLSALGKPPPRVREGLAAQEPS